MLNLLGDRHCKRLWMLKSLLYQLNQILELVVNLLLNKDT